MVDVRLWRVASWLIVLLVYATYVSTVAAHEVAVHKALTDKAVDYLVSKRPDLSGCSLQKVREALRDGVTDEDAELASPIGGYFFHFRPRLNDDTTGGTHVEASCDSLQWSGLLSGNPTCKATVDAVGSRFDGAMVLRNGFRYDSMLADLQSAVPERYIVGFKKLGHLLHLFQDLTSPPHVRNDAHPHIEHIGIVLGDPSSFEVVNANKGVGDIPIPDDGLGLVDIVTLTAAFHELANLVRTRFYSEDTMFVPPGPDAVGVDSDGYVTDHEGRRIAHISQKGLRAPTLADLGRATIDDRVARDQFSELAPVAVLYTASVISHVHDKVVAICNLVDDDRDGLPDAWELTNWGNLTTVNDPNADHDGDGVSNIDEFRAGTNPTDAGSRSALPTPAALAAFESAPRAIRLVWQDTATNETGYRVLRAVGMDQVPTLVAILGPNIGTSPATYEDIGLEAATTYCYRVQAVGGRVTSDPSNVACATTSPTIPAAPSGLTASARSSSEILLGWQDNATNETEYRVERRVGAGGAFSFLTSLAPDTIAFQDGGLTGNTMYCYRIQVVAGTVQSDFSSEACATTSSLIGSNFAISTAPSHQNTPALAFDGTNYLVVWQDLRTDTRTGDIYGARVSSGGVIVDPSGFPISTATGWQQNVAVAFGGSTYLVVWEDYRSGVSQIYGARVTPGGQVLDANGLLISTAVSSQAHPAVAFDGVNYLVVWDDPASSVRGARITPTGVVLDPDGFPIFTAPFRTALGFPSVAFDGVNYLVVYLFDRNVHGARVTPSAVVLDPGDFTISAVPSFQPMPSVAFDGTNYLVVWCCNPQPDASRRSSGARVSSAGQVLDLTNLTISAPPASPGNVRVAFAGSSYLVAWDDDRADVFGTYVSLSGVSETPRGVKISSLPSGVPLPVAFTPAIGASANNFLVGWTDHRNDPGLFGGATNPDIFGQMVPALTTSANIGDNFDDNLLDPARWSVLTPPPGFVATVAETNQRLEISLGPGAGGAGVVSRCVVAGDFDVQVDFALLSWPSLNSHSVRLGVMDFGIVSSSGFGSYGVGIERSSFEVERYVMVFTDGVAHVATSQSTGRLRIVRAASALLGYFHDGNGWVLIGSGLTNPTGTRLSGLGATRFNLDVGTLNPNAPGGILVAFDNFKVNAGIVNCPAASSPNLSVGAVVEPTTTIPVRSGPSVFQPAIVFEPAGAQGIIIDGPTVEDGITWWQLNYNDGISGWSAGEFLAVAQNPTPPSVLPFAPAPISVGVRIQTAANTFVRILPSVFQIAIAVEGTGSLGTVIEGPVSADGATWWHTNYDDGTTGWSIGEFLSVVVQ